MPTTPPWVDVPGWAWIADCGVYTGTDWPPNPPAALPAGADELHFYVGTPQTGPPPFDDASDDFAESFIDTTDSNSYTNGGTLTAGLHLFVGWVGADEPTTEPLTLVPAGYVAGGTGPDLVEGSLSAPLGGVTAEVDTGGGTRDGVLRASLGGVVAHVAIADDISVTVYDPSGQTFLAAVESPSASYRDVLSAGGVGVANVSMPLDDPAVSHIVDRAIVKIGFRGDVRGFIVSDDDDDLAVEGQQRLTVKDAPDLLALLHSGVVYPQHSDIVSDSPATRLYGVMSDRAIAGWYDRSGWGRPVAVHLSEDTTSRLKLWPRDLVKYDPYLIAPAPGPIISQPTGTIAFYQVEFTTTETKQLDFAFTADNYLTMWFENIEIVSPDFTYPLGWQKLYSTVLRVPAGKHRLVCQVENARGWTGHNPMALVGTIFLTNDNGDRTGVFMQTDATHWWATLGRPGWFPAQVMLQALKESQGFHDAGPSYLTPTFTPTHDTNGVPWSTGRNPKWEFTVDMPLDELATDPAISAAGASFDVNARRMTFDAYQRQGTDRRGSVVIDLGDSGGSLVQYGTSQQTSRFTVAKAKLADGQWHTAVDAAGVAAIGRIVRVVDVGNTSSAETAEVVVRQLLAQSATPLVSVNAAELSSVDGPQLNRDVFKGDSVTTPGHRGVGTIGQRTWATNVDATADGPPKTWLELVADPT